jgi:hypothetical protein
MIKKQVSHQTYMQINWVHKANRSLVSIFLFEEKFKTQKKKKYSIEVNVAGSSLQDLIPSI